MSELNSGRLKKQSEKKINCPGCDLENPFLFSLDFKEDGRGGVRTTFLGNTRCQGYDGIFHGGVLSSLLDTAMAKCLLHQGIKALTGELNIRFLEPVPCEAELEIHARIKETLPPLYLLRAEICIDGRVVCRGRGKFMQRNPD
ncbi:PaaI family thioesterase [Desulforhopalus vacuolatus]|uniref:hotdog domain-containing protein n=1 Tax=Desulforhopalus vacuolatus TaxID=40414 RepID=UPI0019669C0C|nr:PaaI family thioesterase [Desulforhopalus vacuolatus]